MNFFEFLFKLFAKKKPQIINYIELNNLIPYLKNQGGVLHLINPNLETLDHEYALLTKEQVEDFLKSDWTNWRIYRKEIFDCDDFAIILLGKFHEKFGSCSVGFALSDIHAFNIFIDINKKVWIIEPQTDKILSLESIKNNKKYYPFKMVLF